MKQHYRGFDITLTASDHWFARIARSQTGKTWSQEIVTPLTEGSAACLRRAQNLVDAFLALRGN